MTELTVADYKKIVEAIEYVQEITELLPPSSSLEKALTEDEREGICFNVRTAVELLNEVLDEIPEGVAS